MRTLKLIDGDLVFNEKSEIELVDGQEEIAQAMKMLLKIRLGEFMLDENVGLKRDNLLVKHFEEDEARSDILEALMPLTDEELIDEVSDMTFNIEKKERSLSIDLVAIINGGTVVSVEGVDVDGS